jgi:hypothetical protein
MFCAAYTLYNIITKIYIQNLSVLYVISHKNCRFRPFSLIFNRFFEILVATGLDRLQPVAVAGCLFLGLKTGPDRTCEHYLIR